MKTIRHIYCVALCLAFGVSYAQTNSLEYTEETAIAEQHEVVALNNTSTALGTEKPAHIGKPEVKIYPEPFLGIVSVNLSNCPGAKICLFDVKGNCLKYQNCKNEECAIFNLKNQPKGIYYMEILSHGEKTVKAIYLQ